MGCHNAVAAHFLLHNSKDKRYFYLLLIVRLDDIIMKLFVNNKFYSQYDGEKEGNLMRKRRNIVAAIVTFIAFWNMSLISYATYGGTVHFVGNPMCQGYYIIDGSLASNPIDAREIGIAILNNYSPSLGSVGYLDYQTFTDGTGVYVAQISEADAQLIQQIDNETRVWLQNNLANIVPNGTHWTLALKMCADWVADRMTYDERALSNPALLTRYQSAITCFSEGRGVCATYASAFNCMVHALPFDPKTQCVDYSATNPLNVATRYVHNDEHGWSAVRINNGWHAFDITFYDNNNGARQPEYLDMGAAALNDGKHSNYYAIYE